MCLYLRVRSYINNYRKGLSLTYRVPYHKIKSPVVTRIVDDILDQQMDEYDGYDEINEELLYVAKALDAQQKGLIVLEDED